LLNDGVAAVLDTALDGATDGHDAAYVVGEDFLAVVVHFGGFGVISSDAGNSCA